MPIPDKTTNLPSQNTIMVDLTPLLPGGHNGGAKIFVLTLLHLLAEKNPSTHFVLLTHIRSHDTLNHMDRPNMTRRVIIRDSLQNKIKNRLLKISFALYKHIPRPARKILDQIGYHAINWVKKDHHADKVLQAHQKTLLFCPFTAPTYHNKNIPTVCVIYDLQYKSYPEFFSAADIVKRNHAFLEAAKHATLLTAISDYSRESAISYGKLEPEKIRTIHLRLANRVLEHAVPHNAILQKLDLTPQHYLLYPANFWQHKNHEMLLTAFNSARQKNLPASIKLVCTGAAGAHQSWLQSVVKAMGLSDTIIFPDYVTDEELALLLSQSLALIFPSLYEGFGLPIAEAMALGVPIACSNTTSLPEVAGDAALLFDPRRPTDIADAIIAVATDKTLRKRLMQAGKTRALEFCDMPRMADEYWQLFEDTHTLFIKSE